MNATTVAVHLAKNIFERYSLSWLAPAEGERKMNALDAMTITEHGKSSGSSARTRRTARPLQRVSWRARDAKQQATESPRVV
jgi:hypothetical protein